MSRDIRRINTYTAYKYAGQKDSAAIFIVAEVCIGLTKVYSKLPRSIFIGEWEFTIAKDYLQHLAAQKKPIVACEIVYRRKKSTIRRVEKTKRKHWSACTFRSKSLRIIFHRGILIVLFFAKFENNSAENRFEFLYKIFPFIVPIPIMLDWSKITDRKSASTRSGRESAMFRRCAYLRRKLGRRRANFEFLWNCSRHLAIVI